MLDRETKLERPIYDTPDKQTHLLTVSDRIQIPSKTTYKDAGTKLNTSYYFIS